MECNHNARDKTDKCPNCGCQVLGMISKIKPKNIVTINRKQRDLSWFVKNMCGPEEDILQYYGRVALLSRRTHIRLRDTVAICDHIREHGYPQKEYNCESQYRKRPSPQNSSTPKCLIYHSGNIQR